MASHDATPATRSADALERIADRLDEICELLRPKKPGPKGPRQLQLVTDDPQDALEAIPCAMGDTFYVYQRHIDVLAEAYPAVDVLQTLKEIKAWAVSNESLRWTSRGALRGVNRWMQNEQNKIATAAARGAAYGR
jgi:hypothetical protein